MDVFLEIFNILDKFELQFQIFCQEMGDTSICIPINFKLNILRVKAD